MAGAAAGPSRARLDKQNNIQYTCGSAGRPGPSDAAAGALAPRGSGGGGGGRTSDLKGFSVMLRLAEGLPAAVGPVAPGAAGAPPARRPPPAAARRRGRLERRQPAGLLAARREATGGGPSPASRFAPLASGPPPAPRSSSPAPASRDWLAEAPHSLQDLGGRRPLEGWTARRPGWGRGGGGEWGRAPGSRAVAPPRMERHSSLLLLLRVIKLIKYRFHIAS